mmetsp:Transcript_2947/g.8424  ORF Transcript_2947/g.8424 Transcript_2947/m.8424 type:complete len:311 (-) Transcript_2947:515-1447(-)
MLDPPGPHHSSPQPKFSAPSRSSRKPRPPRFWRGRPGPQPSARSYSDPPAPCSTSTARPQGQLRRASHRQNTAASKQPTRPAGVVWRQAAARRDARGAGLVALHRDWDRLLLHPLLRRLGRDEHPARAADRRDDEVAADHRRLAVVGGLALLRRRDRLEGVEEPAPLLLLPPAPQLRQLPRLGSILLPLPRGALHRTLNHRRLRVAAAATRRRGGGGGGGRRGLLALPPLVPSRREGAQTRELWDGWAGRRHARNHGGEVERADGGNLSRVAEDDVLDAVGEDVASIVELVHRHAIEVQQHRRHAPHPRD